MRGKRHTRCVGCQRPMGLGYRDRLCNRCKRDGRPDEQLTIREMIAERQAGERERAARGELGSQLVARPVPQRRPRGFDAAVILFTVLILLASAAVSQAATAPAWHQPPPPPPPPGHHHHRHHHHRGISYPVRVQIAGTVPRGGCRPIGRVHWVGWC